MSHIACGSADCIEVYTAAERNIQRDLEIERLRERKKERKRERKKERQVDIKRGFNVTVSRCQLLGYAYDYDHGYVPMTSVIGLCLRL